MRLPLGWLRRVFTRENIWALLLCLIVILLIIATADSAPLWIYQGFQMGLTQILIFAALGIALRLLADAKLRSWLLLCASVLAVYWLQPLTPIRNLDFWFPTLTLALIALGWVLSTPRESRGGRENWTAAGLTAGLVLAVGLTRYLGLDGIITASRPPQTVQVLIALAGVSLILLALARYGRSSSRALSLAIFGLLAVFLLLKVPALSRLGSVGLRTLMDQSTELASALDLRWLGFSYIAFRLIHTLRDRQSGRLPVVSLKEYALYVAFFPALSAGPIDRLERFIKDARKTDEAPAADFFEAAQRVVLGLFKKFVLADTLARVALSPLNALQVQSSGWVWLLLYAYSFQIYLDFSGYTDIAIGLGRLVGFRLPENFNRPYLKPNLTQFWNNWHMTLTQWLRAYVFNPLTRSLRSAQRPLPAWLILLTTQMVTMGLIGLWHGVTWNFLIWGLWHGLGLFAQNRWSQSTRAWSARTAERPALQRAVTIFSTLLTFHYVALGWVWFALPTVPLAGRVLGLLFGVR